MARLARLAVAGQLHHILQRGNNRQPIFQTSADRTRLLEILHAAARDCGVDLHAYVLMDNYFHLLATPHSTESLPRMMQSLGRRYVRHFNATHGRTGTLWEGRYRSSLLEADAFLLPCMVFFDLQAVRAGLVAQASDYPWSSCSHYCGERQDRLLAIHPVVWRLGNTPFAREARYRDLLADGVAPEVESLLMQAVNGGWALGSESFIAGWQSALKRRLAKARAGRPARKIALSKDAEEAKIPVGQSVPDSTELRGG